MIKKLLAVKILILTLYDLNVELTLLIGVKFSLLHPYLDKILYNII